MFSSRFQGLISPFVCLLAVGCGTDSPPDAAVSEEPPLPSEGFVTVNGVRLHYLDWGGMGDGLVFLPGLGDSPHAFDEIAPEFRDQFRVIAFARRAHGRSSGSEGPFDNTTQVEDLRGLLDTLQIQRAALAGWSLGGNEISEFAVRYPERVTGLVYLDCYDWADPAVGAWLESFPVNFLPAPSDLTNRDAFRAWWKRIMAPNVPWSPAMEAQVEDLVEVQPDGSVRLHVSDGIMEAFFATLLDFRPDYGAIQAPILAFFADQYPDGFLEPSAPDTLRQKIEIWHQELYEPWQEEAIRRFRASAPDAHIVMLERTSHSALPFERRDTIVAEMQRFLAPRGEG